MGRKLMRVAMDFDWPLNKVWQGYINPYSPPKCRACDGKGESPEATAMFNEWYGWDLPLSNGTWGYRVGAWSRNLTQADVQALVDADRLWEFTHRPLNEEQKKNCYPNGWTKEPNGYIPAAEEVNKWADNGIGHDSINAWVVVKARCEREGVPSQCKYCDGHGHIYASDEHKRLHETWEDKEPPTGDGFQLWETTSAGSPQSPIFASLEELAEWCEKNADTFAGAKTTKEKWMKMLDENFVYHKEGNAVFI